MPRHQVHLSRARDFLADGRAPRPARPQRIEIEAYSTFWSVSLLSRGKRPPWGPYRRHRREDKAQRRDRGPSTPRRPAEGQGDAQHVLYRYCQRSG